MDSEPPRTDAKPETGASRPSDSNDKTSADSTSGAGHPRRRRLLIIGGISLAVLVGAGVLLWWLRARHYEPTDDAFVDANVAQLSAQVTAPVARILVDDNQQVAAGAVLIELDPRDYQVRRDQAAAQRASAEAQLKQAEAQLEDRRAGLAESRAQVSIAEADLTQAQEDFDRFKAIDPRAVSRQQIDNATAALRSAQAKLASTRQSVVGAEAQLQVAAAQIGAAQAGMRTAQVAVDQAELQLSYCHIIAPFAGRVAKRGAQLGNLASPGQALLALVAPERWVTANFKETQLTDMRQGQAVALDIDAFPAHALRGEVESLQPGTGSAFSLLPAENATGNWVKVVQRLPVRIRITDPRARQLRLEPGMSVTATVRVR